MAAVRREASPSSGPSVASTWDSAGRLHGLEPVATPGTPARVEDAASRYENQPTVPEEEEPILWGQVFFRHFAHPNYDAGLLEIARLAETLREVTATIPADLDWVVQINGHTDRRPIASERFPSNWELSAARAIAIVKTMVARGLPPERLSAAGYGEFQPLDSGVDEQALARNRRIEIKLTSR